MPDTVIDIPGVGVVSFPDSMKSDEINMAAAKLYQGAQKAAQPAQAAPQAESFTDVAVRNVKDLAGGVGAGIANTVIGGGDLIRRATGMERIKDDPSVKALTTPPDSAAGKAGYYGEQIGEFFLPTGLAGKAGKLAEVAKSGALTLAQTGEPVGAGVSAALTAVLPGGSAAKRAAGALERSAEKNVTQAITGGAGPKWVWTEAKKLAPEIVERGVKGSRQRMLAQASERVAATGQKLGSAIDDAAKAGVAIDGNVARGNIQLAARALQTTDEAGNVIPVAGTEAVINKLGELDEFVSQLGTSIPIDKAQFVKKAWDNIVSKAGLFGPKATASATDNANAWAVREAAGSFRDLINHGNVDIAALNKEFAFWKGLKNVLTETETRTQKYGAGLTNALFMGAGGVGGFASGNDMSDSLVKAAKGAALGKVLMVTKSPAWKTAVSAPMKDMLARALASGNAERVEMVSKALIKSLPAQFRDTVSP